MGWGAIDALEFGTGDIGNELCCIFYDVGTLQQSYRKQQVKCLKRGKKYHKIIDVIVYR